MAEVLPKHGQRFEEMRPADPVRHPLRLDLGRLLDRRDGRRRAAARPRHEPARARPRRRAAAAARSGVRTAIVMPICNEHVPTVFGGLAATIDSLRATGESESFDVFVLSDTNDPDIRAAEQAAWSDLAGRLAADSGRRRPALRLHYRWRQRRDTAQGRQRRRLLPPLGRRLPLHHRPRRRQRHDRRMPDDAGAADGSASRRRHHPDRAARGRPRDAPRPRPAVLRARLRAAVHRRHALLAARRIALLGPQRHPAHGAVHAPLRARAAARHGLALGRDPVARLRRGGADAPRRLEGLGRRRARRQLRAGAAQPARRAAARPPLVPRQPAELAPDVRAAPARRCTAPRS